jgi:hypothetical protein
MNYQLKSRSKHLGHAILREPEIFGESIFEWGDFLPDTPEMKPCPG